MKGIKDAMLKKGIPEETMAQFDFSVTKENQSEKIIALINQMDKLLTKKQCLSIMEEQGCCTTGKPAAAHRAFGRKYADKTIEEKIKLFDELDTPHKPPCRLNDDGTLSVFWGFEKEGKYKCVCGYIKKLPQPIKVSKTFCGCCGGHARQNLQKSLGTNLQLKEIVSSAISTGGKKRCEFLFRILDK
jgi:bacterioferritin-associated ferredoxin